MDKLDSMALQHRGFFRGRGRGFRDGVRKPYGGRGRGRGNMMGRKPGYMSDEDEIDPEYKNVVFKIVKVDEEDRRDEAVANAISIEFTKEMITEPLIVTA
mmetsp:Transcript_10332/g.15848  ORF Transcript_10332/g.15848 Transcript_10332/m.15848 type:complete len:100 (-) Transcript_10332:740-1039(-)